MPAVKNAGARGSGGFRGSARGLRAGGDGAAGHDADEVGAVGGAGMHVAIHVFLRRGDAFEGGRRERFVERGFHGGVAEDAVIAGTGDGDASAVGGLGDEHADGGVARGRVGEFFVGGFMGDGEADFGDDFIGVEGGGEHALEELIGLKAAFIGFDGGAKGEHGGGVAGRRVVIGEGAADGAAIADLAITDMAGEMGEGWDGFGDHRRGCDLAMGGHGFDGEAVAFVGDAGEAEAGQIDDGAGLGEALLEHRDEGHAAGEGFGVVMGEGLGGIGQGGGFVIFEIIHGFCSVIRRPCAGWHGE